MKEAISNQSTSLVSGDSPVNLSVIQQLFSKLTDIKDKIKSGTIGQDVFDELSKQAKTIQDKLNDLMSNKGILTQSDINDAYATLQEVQRKEFEMRKKIAGRNAMIFVGLGVAAIIGVYYLFKRSK